MMALRFKPGQVVEEFDIDGKRVIFRIIWKEDLQGCLDHINSLIRQKTYISWLKPFTLEEEREWLDKELQDNQKGNKITLMIEIDGKIVGDAFVGRRPMQAVEHRAIVGVGLSSERGKGIGFRMMRTLERLAKEHYNAEMLELEVFEDNRAAINLYKKFGFIETGRIPGGFKHYGKIMDDILMVKRL